MLMIQNEIAQDSIQNETAQDSIQNETAQDSSKCWGTNTLSYGKAHVQIETQLWGTNQISTVNVETQLSRKMFLTIAIWGTSLFKLLLLFFSHLSNLNPNGQNEENN